MGGHPWALGIPAMAYFIAPSSGFLALGECPWPHAIPADDAASDLGGGAGTFGSYALGGRLRPCFCGALIASAWK